MKSPLQVPQTLVKLCLRFYRPESFYTPKTANTLRIMTSAKNVLKASTTPKEDSETLIAEVAGRILKDLDRVRSGAKGCFQIGNREEEITAIRTFSRYYVEELFLNKFNADKAMLSSERNIGLIEDTFEMLMREQLHRLGNEKKANEKSIEISSSQAVHWSVDRVDDLEYVISNSVGLEIVIKDFDPKLAIESILDSGLEVKSLKYPLELPSDWATDCVWLEVTTVTNYESFSGTLHIGSKVSIPVPFDFAKSLQSILKSPIALPIS